MLDTKPENEQTTSTAKTPEQNIEKPKEEVNTQKLDTSVQETKGEAKIDIKIDPNDPKEEDNEIIYGRSNENDNKYAQIKDLESQMYSAFNTKFHQYIKDPKQNKKIPPPPSLNLNFPVKENESKSNIKPKDEPPSAEILQKESLRESQNKEEPNVSPKDTALESTKPASIIDDWSLFEESEKKKSKSQKKKEKRKSKKKAEQEMLKAQEQEQEKEENENEGKEKVEEEEKKEKPIEMVDIELQVIKKEENKPEEKITNNNKEKEEKELKKPTSNKKKQNNNKRIENVKKEKKEIEEVKEAMQAPESRSDSSRNTSRKNSEISQHSKNIVHNNNNNNYNRRKPQNQKGKINMPTESTSNRKLSEIFTKDSWKEDATVTNNTVSVAPPDFDESGFIEVKAKKKPEKEKETRQKRKNNGKESWRRKEEKTAAGKEAKKGRSPVRTKFVEQKKESNENNEKPVNKNNTKINIPMEKTRETEAPQKSNVGIPKVFLSVQNNTAKSGVSKPVKKPITAPARGTSSSSENDTTSCTSKTTSKTSSSSDSNNVNSANHQVHKQSSRAHNKHENQGGHHHKNHKNYHPLSIASPSLNLETIKISRTKEFANQVFNKKLESDIYKHVAGLTEASNKIMDYRILAYRRLDCCISKLFPSNICLFSLLIFFIRLEH